MTNDYFKPIPVGCNPLANSPVKDVCQMAEARNLSLYLVGGYLRDCIHPKKKFHGSNHLDFDFAVGKIDATEFAREVAEKMSGHFVLLDNKNDTARVVLEDGTYLDFAGCVGGSIETDIRRRDFTINSLAWSPERPDEILDLTGGLSDLENGLIRVVEDANLIDDPLRLLRAFRFASQLGLTIEDRTLGLITENASLIESVPHERVNYELFLLAELELAGHYLSQMANCGLLEYIFPELKATRKVTANQFHHLGLFEHSIETVKQTEEYIKVAPDWILESSSRELMHGVSRLSATKIACLLHDIGKPETWNVTEEGRHTFLGHDKLGGTMTNVLALRSRWSKPVTRFISNLVKWHLRPGHLFHQGEPTQRAINKFYRTVNEHVPELMLLAYGDLGATRGDGFTEDVREKLKNNFDSLSEGFLLFQERERKLPRLLDGTRVMEILTLEPGPKIGRILEALEEAQALEEVLDVPAAEAFVVEFHKKKYGA